MDLYKEILVRVLERSTSHVEFGNFIINANDIVELSCYQALLKIKEIIEDDSMEDPECFYKIENIVCELERLGSDGGLRHDFG